MQARLYETGPLIILDLYSLNFHLKDLPISTLLMFIVQHASTFDQYEAVSFW